MLDRMRNIPWKLIGYTCLGILALAGIGLLMGLIQKKDAEQVCTSMKVMVGGKETFIDQNDISELVKAKFGGVVGKPLHQIPVEQMEKSLSDLPYVASAEIYVDMDGILQVAVQQREVMLRII